MAAHEKVADTVSKASPIGAVAGAAGAFFNFGSSITNLLGGKKERQFEQLQFSNNLTQSVLTNRYNRQAAEQNQINQDKAQKRLLVNGVFVVLGILVLVLVLTLTKNDKKQ